MKRDVYKSPAWRALRLVILERDGWRCQIATRRCTITATEVDHIVPLADGGPAYEPANCRAACKTCNSWLAAQRTNTNRRRARANRRTW